MKNPFPAAMYRCTCNALLTDNRLRSVIGGQSHGQSQSGERPQWCFVYFLQTASTVQTMATMTDADKTSSEVSNGLTNSQQENQVADMLMRRCETGKSGFSESGKSSKNLL